ncbi:Nek/nek1 protein kinase [Globisporangium polare]
MDNYVKIKLLGEGSFGRVFLMREKQPGGRLVCVKEIHSIHTPKTSSSNSSAPVMEVQLMKKLSHPNLIRFLASFSKTSSDKDENRGKSSTNSCIVMEFCSGGDLRAYLNKHRNGSKARSSQPQSQQLTEDLIWFWFLQLCLGLHHMHQLQILHRDVKTSNVFLSNAGFLVLGDFGIARELSGPHDMASTVIGTPLYMAPETLEGKPYSFASDIWALGCVLYEICTGNPPFIAKSTPALIHKICESKFVPLSRTRFSSRLQDLVTKMLSVDVKNRLTAASILKDPSMHAHLKRYFHDRFALSSSGMSNKTRQQEEQAVLSKQLQSLGVTFTVSPTSDARLDAKQVNQGHGGGDTQAKSSHKEISEAKLMAEREHERRQQLLVALDKLQRLRLQEGLAGASDSKDDLEAHVMQGEHTGGRPAAEQRPDPVFPQFRRASENDEIEIRWKDPVRDRPRSSSGRDHEKARKPSTNCNSNSASAALSSFLGIPRKGVPLTTQAREFANRSPICKDIRVLRKQERAKAADKYKQGLAAIKPLRAAQPPAAAGAQQRPMAEEPTDDAILHSIQELQEALGVKH